LTAGRAGLRAIAAGVVLLAAVALYGSLRIPEGTGYVAVGPRAFPLVVSAGLLLVGVVLLLRVTLLPDRDLLERAAEESAATRWRAPALLALGLLLYALALGPLGYVAATALFFAAAAWTLGAPRPLRPLLIGAVLATVVYLAFTRGLGVRLPAGPLG